MGKMIYKVYVLNLKWRNITVNIGLMLNVINTPENANAMWRHSCFEEQGLLDDIHAISNDL